MIELLADLYQYTVESVVNIVIHEVSMGVTKVSHIEQDRIDFVRCAIFFFG